MLDGVDISGPVNLPPPCLWRRCPVLHHDRIVSALVIQFVHWRVMRWTSIDSQARISPVCGQPKTDLWLRGRFSAEVGSRYSVISRVNHPRRDLARSIGVCPASPPTP